MKQLELKCIPTDSVVTQVVGALSVESRLYRDTPEPEQLGLPWYGREIDVDHKHDMRRDHIMYLGKATHIFDDEYRCLANVGGALCVVKVTIRPHDHLPPSPATRV